MLTYNFDAEVISRNHQDKKVESEPKMLQWMESSKGQYEPIPNTTTFILPAGFYEASSDKTGIFLKKVDVSTDELMALPEVTEGIIKSIEVFWKSKEKFDKLGQMFRRGILLHGPPGISKTSIILLLCKDLIKKGGLVLNLQDVLLATKMLKTIRTIEPERPIIGILEDIDKLIEMYDETTILSLLDGEHKIDNIIFLATTNFPEKLDKRIIDRPSRFDDVIKIDYPSDSVKEVYIRSRLSKDQLSDKDIQTWLRDTKNFSIADIKELIISIYCLNRDYQETLARLRSMKKLPKSTDNNNSTAVGFNAN